jgi:hypothetical protein
MTLMCTLNHIKDQKAYFRHTSPAGNPGATGEAHQVAGVRVVRR